jgi:hypothetical protein
MNNSNLPGGWKAVFDKAAGHTYYIDKVTQETTWTKPTAPTASYLAGYPMPLSNANAAWANAEQKRLIKKGQQMKNAELAAEAPAREAARQQLEQKQRDFEAVIARRQAEAQARMNIIKAKVIQSRIDRASKPLTKKFADIITSYFKVQIESDKISLILAALDKQGINSSLPTYSNYVKKYQTTMTIAGKFKQQFDAYLNIGGEDEYRGKYIGGERDYPILEKMYLSETSGLIPTEQWARNEKINDKFSKLSEDEIKEAEERKRHIPAQFMIPAYIFSYMQNRQIDDTFYVNFPSPPGENMPQNKVENFNMQMLIALENSVRAETKVEKFDSLYEDSSNEDNYMHILDKLYRAELSGTMESKIKNVIEAEEDAVKEAKKSIVKPLGHNIVRENQNNHFGGTRRRRRNRKSTRRNRKSTRGNRRN